MNGRVISVAALAVVLGAFISPPSSDGTPGQARARPQPRSQPLTGNTESVTLAGPLSLPLRSKDVPVASNETAVVLRVNR